MNKGAPHSGYAVLPVGPSGGGVTMRTGLPSPIDAIKILEWTNSPAEVVPDIFRAAELATRDYRVFISYRQEDGAGHAERLFAALARRGFDVFLDRVRIAVGHSIPDRIQEELTRKSVLLVLETPKVGQSTWVAREIGIAAANRLAIRAIHFPQGTKLRSLSDRRRHVLGAGDFDLKRRLKRSALERICDHVAILQDYWLTRRRYQMQRALSKALLQTMTCPDPVITNQRLTPEGHLDLVPNWRPATVCSVRWSPGLPEIDDFRRLDRSVAPPQVYQRAVIARGVGSQGQQQDNMAWLSNLLRLPWYDEAEIPLLAARLRAGAGTLKK